METFWRIQPKGLGINHYSTTSQDETADGLHVFSQPDHVFCTDGNLSSYGNEVIEISSHQSWDNEDVEGVSIDPEESEITARYSIREFALLLRAIANGEVEKPEYMEFLDQIKTAVKKLERKEFFE